MYACMHAWMDEVRVSVRVRVRVKVCSTLEWVRVRFVLTEKVIVVRFGRRWLHVKLGSHTCDLTRRLKLVKLMLARPP